MGESTFEWNGQKYAHGRDRICVNCGNRFGAHMMGGYKCPTPKVGPCSAHDAASAREELHAAAERESDERIALAGVADLVIKPIETPTVFSGIGVVRSELEPDHVLHNGPLPTEAQARKAVPIFSGVLRYFPDALAAVAECSKKGNDQHNPGKPLHWDRSKSQDEHDALVRHLMEAGTVDTDGVRHSTKVAWRALAALQKEIERDRAGR